MIVLLPSWPDGTLKWTGHSLAAEGAISDGFHVAPGTPTEPKNKVSVADSQSSVVVSTGSFSGLFNLVLLEEILFTLTAATFNKTGDTLISQLTLDGKVKAQNGQLVAHIQDTPDQPELGGSQGSIAITTGNIETVNVEQSGPVRAVVKVKFNLEVSARS